MERGPLKSRLPDLVPNSGWAHTTEYFLSSMHVLIEFWGPREVSNGSLRIGKFLNWFQKISVVWIPDTFVGTNLKFVGIRGSTSGS